MAFVLLLSVLLIVLYVIAAFRFGLWLADIVCGTNACTGNHFTVYFVTVIFALGLPWAILAEVCN